MKRRKTRGKAGRVQRGKALRPRSASKAASNRRRSGSDTIVAQFRRERDEALGQLAATSDVLRMINASPGNLAPVFDAMLERATHLCEAGFGVLWLFDGERFSAAAEHAIPDALAEFVREPVPVEASASLTEIVKGANVVHVSDLAATELYDTGNHVRRAYVQLGGARTLMSVALRKDNVLLGAFNVYRQEVRPFTERQIELVNTFATQAVIAIENTRLLNELRQRTDDLSESLEQQTATSEVLNVISRSPSDAAPVFEAIVTSAARLCGATFCNVQLYDGELMHIAAVHNFSAEAEAAFRKMYPRPPDRSQIASRAVLTGAPVYVRDLLEDPDYPRAIAITGGWRALFAVPMLRNGKAIGAIAVARSEPEAFSEQQVSLLNIFADQAVIAIENMRLFESVQARTRELAKSLEELRTTQDRLVQTQKLALLGQLTAGIAHEIKNPLNFVNNFSGISAELIDELQNTLKGMPLDDKVRAEINELTGTLKSNFDKVLHHGRRADAIVKSMLQHSREGSGEHRVIDINALVDESLNLAWHGARAEAQGFEIKLKQSFDPSAGEADIFPQDIRRALLNMISNGFYAAIRRRAETNGGYYEPTLTASTKNLGDHVEVRIRDNGIGMTPDVKEKMFNPFFTTKPTGEGTGLGLSISHDIIVKQHGGSIEVDTQPGQFTEITVILPRVAAFV